jgi:hypothetical protein
VNDGGASVETIKSFRTSLYNEYLVESAKSPPNYYSVKLIIDAYNSLSIYNPLPTPAEATINTALTTGAGGQPIYTAYTNANKYDLTYLTGVPDSFKILPTGRDFKEPLNYWIYFINSVYTYANAFLNTIDASGTIDQNAYNAQKLIHVGDPASDIANRASDRAQAANLLRTPASARDLSLGPVSSSGPPKPAGTGGYRPPILPSNSGPVMKGAGRADIQGARIHW